MVVSFQGNIHFLFRVDQIAGDPSGEQAEPQDKGMRPVSAGARRALVSQDPLRRARRPGLKPGIHLREEDVALRWSCRVSLVIERSPLDWPRVA